MKNIFQILSRDDINDISPEKFFAAIKKVRHNINTINPMTKDTPIAHYLRRRDVTKRILEILITDFKADVNIADSIHELPLNIVITDYPNVKIIEYVLRYTKASSLLFQTTEDIEHNQFYTQYLLTKILLNKQIFLRNNLIFKQLMWKIATDKDEKNRKDYVSAIEKFMLDTHNNVIIRFVFKAMADAHITLYKNELTPLLKKAITQSNQSLIAEIMRIRPEIYTDNFHELRKSFTHTQLTKMFGEKVLALQNNIIILNCYIKMTGAVDYDEETRTKIYRTMHDLYDHKAKYKARYISMLSQGYRFINLYLQNKYIQQNIRIDQVFGCKNTMLHFLALDYKVMREREQIFNIVTSRMKEDDFRIENEFGQTPITIALLCNNKHFIRFYAQVSQNRMIVDASGNTALHVLARTLYGLDEISQILAILRFDTMDISKYFTNNAGCTPLYDAIYFSNVPFLKWWVEQQGVMDRHDVYGRTLWHYFAASHHDSRTEEIYRILYQHIPALIDVQDIAGSTPLQVAVESTNVDALRYILYAHDVLNFDHMDQNGNTIAHIMANNHALEINFAVPVHLPNELRLVTMLLPYKEKIKNNYSIRNNEGHLPRDIFERAVHHKLFTYICGVIGTELRFIFDARIPSDHYQKFYNNDWYYTNDHVQEIIYDIEHTKLSKDTKDIIHMLSFYIAYDSDDDNLENSLVHTMINAHDLISRKELVIIHMLNSLDASIQMAIYGRYNALGQSIMHLAAYEGLNVLLLYVLESLHDATQVYEVLNKPTNKFTQDMLNNGVWKKLGIIANDYNEIASMHGFTPADYVILSHIDTEVKQKMFDVLNEYISKYNTKSGTQLTVKASIKNHEFSKYVQFSDTSSDSGLSPHDSLNLALIQKYEDFLQKLSELCKATYRFYPLFYKTVKWLEQITGHLYTLAAPLVQVRGLEDFRKKLLSMMFENAPIMHMTIGIDGHATALVVLLDKNKHYHLYYQNSQPWPKPDPYLIRIKEIYCEVLKEPLAHIHEINVPQQYHYDSSCALWSFINHVIISQLLQEKYRYTMLTCCICDDITHDGNDIYLDMKEAIEQKAPSEFTKLINLIKKIHYKQHVKLKRVKIVPNSRYVALIDNNYDSQDDDVNRYVQFYQSTQDIVDDAVNSQDIPYLENSELARMVHYAYSSMFDVYTMNAQYFTSNQGFAIVSLDTLSQHIDEFHEIVNNGALSKQQDFATRTFIIHIKDFPSRFTTLVMTNMANSIYAYYFDPLGLSMPESIKNILDKIPGIEAKQFAPSIVLNNVKDVALFAFQYALNVHNMLSQIKHIMFSQTNNIMLSATDKIMQSETKNIRWLQEKVNTNSISRHHVQKVQSYLKDKENPVTSGQEHHQLKPKAVAAPRTLEEATQLQDYHYWLEDQDIRRIAHLQYRNIYDNIHAIDSDDNIGNHRFIVASVDEEGFPISILNFMRNTSSLDQSSTIHTHTFIINQGNQHWTTLVLAYDNGKYYVYYIDSLGHQIPLKIRRIIQSYPINNIQVFRIQQQTDGHNCGLWSLENARDINIMLKEKKDLEWLREQLHPGRLQRNNEQYFIDSRIALSIMLVENYQGQENIPESTDTDSTSGSECLGGRVKRSVNDCLYSWEDVDKFNEVEQEDRRNKDKIKIDSEKFLNYIRNTKGHDKRVQLIEFADEIIRSASNNEEKLVGKSQNLVNKIINNHKVMNHLDKVAKISEITTTGMISKNIVADFLHEDYKGVAINLGFIAGGHGLAKASGIVSMQGSKLASQDQFILGRTLRLSAPFIARGTSVFIIYDLVNQVKELNSGNRDALVGVIGDSLYLTIDVAEIGAGLAAEVFGALEGLSAVTGPVGAAIGAIVFVGTDIYFAVKKVDQMDQVIHLTGWEKFKEGWRAFLDMDTEQYLQELIEEKEVNNQLVREKMQFLKQHPDIQRYVFPTGRLVVDDERHLIQMDLDNIILLDKKSTNIKWSRSKPDDPSEGEIFCYPEGEDTQVSNGGAYRCKNAIGVVYSENRIGNNTIIDLGKGNDTVVGFPDSANIFLINDGHKSIYGGNKNDLFILRGDSICGLIHGTAGSNTLDVSNFSPGNIQVEIFLNSTDADPIPEDICSTYFNFQPLLLSLQNITKVIGRKNTGDTIHSACDTEFINSQGGIDHYTRRDKIHIKADPHCFYKMHLQISSNTEVNNHALQGNFSYHVKLDQGSTYVFLANLDPLHEFFFNHTLSEVQSIMAYTSMTRFSFGENKSFEVTHSNNTNNFYYLSDNTILRVDGHNMYATQNSNKDVNEIIREYPDIADRLKMFIVVKSLVNNETVSIGHGNHEIISNDPFHKSHLICSTGEDIYLITSGHKKLNIDADLTIPEITIYNFNRSNQTNIIDLSKISKQIERDTNHTLNTILVHDTIDILIQLYIMDKTRLPIKKVTTIILKDTFASKWYEKLHVILHNVPMKIDYSGGALYLLPQPIVFDNETEIMVITTRDIEKSTELVIPKKIGQHSFCYIDLYHFQKDLIVTNVFDSNIGQENYYTVLLSDFYKQVNKMKILQIKFVDKTITLEDERDKINNATAFFDKLFQYEYESDIDSVIVDQIDRYITNVTSGIDESHHHRHHHGAGGHDRHPRSISGRDETIVQPTSSSASRLEFAPVKWFKTIWSTLVNMVKYSDTQTSVQVTTPVLDKDYDISTEDTSIKAHIDNIVSNKGLGYSHNHTHNNTTEYSPITRVPDIKFIPDSANAHNQEYHSNGIDLSVIDNNSNLLLLNLGIRMFTGVKYPTNNQSIFINNNLDIKDYAQKLAYSYHIPNNEQEDDQPRQNLVKANTLEVATELEDYTYCLEDHDIRRIAHLKYSDMYDVQTIDDNYDTSNKGLIVISDVEQQGKLTMPILEFMQNMSTSSIDSQGTIPTRTFIINKERVHWTTLVIAYRGGQHYHGYYIDSFGHPMPPKIAIILEQYNVMISFSSQIVQQEDGYNCGFWALENGRDINIMLQEEKDLEWLRAQLNPERLYRDNAQYFINSRIELSETLLNDELNEDSAQSSNISYQYIHHWGEDDNYRHPHPVSEGDETIIKTTSFSVSRLYFAPMKSAQTIWSILVNMVKYLYTNTSAQVTTPIPDMDCDISKKDTSVPYSANAHNQEYHSDVIEPFTEINNSSLLGV